MARDVCDVYLRVKDPVRHLVLQHVGLAGGRDVLGGREGHVGPVHDHSARSH